MATTHSSDAISAHELRDQEAGEAFDELVRRRLNMTREEFLAAWDSGAFPDPENPDVLWVSMFLPFIR